MGADGILRHHRLKIPAPLFEGRRNAEPSRPSQRGFGMWLYLRLFVLGLRIVGRSRRDVILENLVLRQQLAVDERVPRRAPLRPADRRFGSTIARGWLGWRRHVHLVEPATVVRWHRTAWRRYWRWKSPGPRPGRPRIDAKPRALIDRLATDNPRWGAQRIVYELRALGIDASRATVNRYRPRRAPSLSGRQGRWSFGPPQRLARLRSFQNTASGARSKTSVRRSASIQSTIE